MLDNKPVVLLQPPNMCKTFTRSGSVYPPLGLCMLAAVDRNNIIQILDAEGEGLSDVETKKRLTDIKPKIVGLTATSFTLDLVEQWAHFAKSIGATVIVGGPHPSLDPKGTFDRCSSVEFIVRGEGEVVINELVESILENRFNSLIKGVCRRRINDYQIDSHILKVDDFDKVPFPLLEGLPIVKYWCPDVINTPMVTMLTTRGCPYKCHFCSSPAVMGRKIRGWSIAKIIAELKFLHFELGVKEISFVDDVFTINRKRTIELCNEMVKNNLKITWFCNARADHITEEIAFAMKNAGCHQVYLGFESGDQGILNNIKKGTTVDRLTKGANILQNHGIGRSIGFVLGLPGETDETVERSIALAKKLKPERLQFTRFTPLVGSALENFKFETNGFHEKGNDQVGRWIQQAYQECQSPTWGKESW